MNPYDVIRGASITEKSETIRALEQTMCFRVHPGATKTDIKNAVQKIFKVKVACGYGGRMFDGDLVETTDARIPQRSL